MLGPPSFMLRNQRRTVLLKRVYSAWPILERERDMQYKYTHTRIPNTTGAHYGVHTLKLLRIAALWLDIQFSLETRWQELLSTATNQTPRSSRFSFDFSTRFFVFCCFPCLSLLFIDLLDVPPRGAQWLHYTGFTLHGSCNISKVRPFISFKLVIHFLYLKISNSNSNLASDGSQLVQRKSLRISRNG